MSYIQFFEGFELKSGATILNMRAAIDAGAAITAVMKYVSASNDYQFYNGTKWVSMSGFKSANKVIPDTADTFGVLEGLSTDGTTYEFRSIKAGSSKISISKAGGIITLDLGTVPISAISGLQAALDNKVDKVAGKGLSTEDLTTALKDKLDSITIVKKGTPNPDQSATYQLQATFGGSPQVLGADIDIPKDMVIQSGTVGTVTVTNQPYTGAVIGDKYIDLLLANSANTHIYVPVKSLVDIYTGAATTEITVSVNNTTNVITATLNDGAIALGKLASIVLGTITESNTEATTTATPLLTVLQSFAKNIKYLFNNKANNSQTITAPSASSTQNVAGSFSIVAILQILINNVKQLFDTKAENSQTVTAPTASNTQQGAGSATIVSILQTLMNNVKHLFDNKADNSQTMVAPSANETQVTAGSKTILSVLATYANNIAAIFNRFTALNLQKVYVSGALTGTGGTITAATHGVTSPKVVTCTVGGIQAYVFTSINSSTKDVTWSSQTSFIAGDAMILTIIG